MTATQYLAQGGDPSNIHAYLLTRFSTGEQKNGSSLWRQTERGKADVLRRGWKYDEKLCVTDLGVSAFRKKNFQPKAALGKFIEASKNGMLLPYPVLVIEEPSRFSRAAMDEADAELWALVKRGVDVLFVSFNMLLTKGDENKPAVRIQLMFAFDLAHTESQRKKEFTDNAIKKKLIEAQKGKVVNFGRFRPTWVDFVPGAKGEADTFKLNARATIVRRAYQEYVLEGKSLGQIVSKFSAEQIPSFYAKAWHMGVVSALFRNENLLGTTTIKVVRLDHY
jgi:DNA invertase Pin-like site-specific DNA recombinase